MILAAALLLAAAPAEWPEDSGPAGHIGIGVGIGSAYGGAGAHLELGVGSFALYGGIGLTLALFDYKRVLQQVDGSSPPPLCGGIRWYSDRFFLSLNAARATVDYHYDGSVPTSMLMHGSLLTFAATFGKRWRWGVYSLELALGTGVARAENPGNGTEFGPPPGTAPSVSIYPILDLSMAVGLGI
ncbi:MAG: hypothetical protein E6J78_15625 [Deltaproteobacteria bacterium]|nr:MAG: hypothetical protein E6J78_15625 [Deltaproteobacteria bacterium]